MGLLLVFEISSIPFQSRLATSARNLQGPYTLAVEGSRSISLPEPGLLGEEVHLPNPPRHLLWDLELALDLLGPSRVAKPDELEHGLIDAESRKRVCEISVK